MRSSVLGLCLMVLMVWPAAAFGEEAQPAKEPEKAPKEDGKKQAEPPAPKDKTEPKTPTKMDDVMVTASRSKQLVLDSPRSVTLISESRLDDMNNMSILDALKDQTGVWLYKRNASESDPVIRGFSGANLLALVDGDTLTTLWGEGGEGMDDLYAKIESDSIERIEVVRGPASVTYGSNTLGGVVNFITRKCRFDYTEPGGFRIGGRLKYAHDTAQDENHGRGEVWMAMPRAKLFLGASARKVHTTKAGGGDWMHGTGSEDVNANACAEFKLADEHYLELTYQHMDRDKAYRYHRANQLNSNDRDAGHIQYSWRTDGCLRELSWRNYYQYKRDRRFYTDTDNVGTARWDTWQQTLQGDLRFGDKDQHHVVVGFANQVDFGMCPDDEQFMIETPAGAKTKDSPDSTWWDFGMYGMEEWKVTDDLSLSAAVRVDVFTFDSHVDKYYVPPSPLQDPDLDEISEDKAIPSGGVGAVYRVYRKDPDVRIFGNYSHGFRLNPPVFGLTQHGQGIRAPSGMLDPIVSDTVELGVRNSGTYMRGSLAGYYSWFDNFQKMASGSFNGSDWFDWNGNGVRDPGENILVTRDTGTAYLYGMEFEQHLRFDRLLRLPGHWWVGGGLAWNYGEDEEGDYLRFTHPFWGFAKLRWEQGDLWKNSWVKGLYFEYEARMVDRFDKIPRGYIFEDRGYRRNPKDTSSPLVRPYGLPGYTVHDFRAGVRLKDHVRVSMNIENFTDKHYREAHGRVDAAGINFILGIEFHW